VTTPSNAKGFVLLVAALLSIPAAISGTLYYLGVYKTMKYDWLLPYAPYIYSVIAFSIFAWGLWVVMDYLDVRRAALSKSVTTPNIDALIETERQETKRVTDAINWAMNNHIEKINERLNSLTPKPALEPTLKERTMQLANDLLAMLKEQGPEPPHALSSKGTEKEQRQTFDKYFDYQKSTFWKYMARFRDRVVKIDFELAALGIYTKFEEREIDPPRPMGGAGEVRVRQIAEKLLLAASQLPS
jgi:hypothetical protein